MVTPNHSPKPNHISQTPSSTWMKTWCPNTVNNKECDLTETQKKLKKHGYGVDNDKAGLGFTPNAHVKISSKAKNASTQHISVNIEQDQ
ncbi:hypothetical protein ACFX1R_035876 [Malus domestica]